MKQLAKKREGIRRWIVSHAKEGQTTEEVLPALHHSPEYHGRKAKATAVHLWMTMLHSLSYLAALHARRARAAVAAARVQKMGYYLTTCCVEAKGGTTVQRWKILLAHYSTMS